MSLNIAPRLWITGGWVTSPDIGGAGTGQITSDVIVVPLPTVSVADLTIEVEFSQRLIGGVGGVNTLVKIIRSNLFGESFVMGGSAKDFLSPPVLASNINRLRRFSFRALQVANSATSDAAGESQLRMQLIGYGALETSQWEVKGIRARCVYLPV